MDLQALPLLQHMYSDGRSALSRPPLRRADGSPLPQRFALCFMRSALDDYVRERGLSPACVHESETADFPIFVERVNDVEVGLVHAPVGAPAAAILLDRLIDSGATRVISCGGCGVLEPVDCGVIVIPTRALRDEGTSYHYAAPSPAIDLDPSMVDVILRALDEHEVPCRTGMTWTCDGFFRETPGLIRQRREQGCLAVDMEVSALAAVARFYGIGYGAILYSGDSLSNPDAHEHRDWISNHTARSISLVLSLRAISYTNT
ncbi:MAG: nucleoside phosphorylase [Coriobacteriia bacterium]|nr:nucleoside phosphorylase [Coriobacteriia bacterium]